MVPCPWARGAAAGYRGEDVGVHLTVNAEYDLYRWGPITHAPSLLDGDGGFPRTIEDVWDHADLDEVRRECRAQIERAILWGFDVSHLDAHMGTMQIKSEFFDVYLDLAVEFGCPCAFRAPTPRALIGFPFRALAAEEGVVFPDDFVYVPGVGSRQILLDAIAGLKPGVTEAYLHPAVDSPELEAMATDWEAAGRRPPLARPRRRPARRPRRRRRHGDRLPARCATSCGRSPDCRAPRQRRSAERSGDQNSVMAAISVCSCLYSGELVMGSRDMTLAMLPGHLHLALHEGGVGVELTLLDLQGVGVAGGERHLGVVEMAELALG